MTGIQTITAACVRTDSFYYQIPDVVPWDKRKNIFKCTDHYPIIAHPPCAQWGRTAPLAKQDMVSKTLAVHCLAFIRKNGGVLEHPEASGFWEFAAIPVNGRRDAYGGLCVLVDQYDYGHPARKRTLLYFYGLPAGVTAMQVAYRLSQFSVRPTAPPRRVMSCVKADRELTPLPLAKALCDAVHHWGLSQLTDDGRPRRGSSQVVWDGTYIPLFGSRQ